IEDGVEIEQDKKKLVADCEVRMDALNAKDETNRKQVQQCRQLMKVLEYKIRNNDTSITSQEQVKDNIEAELTDWEIRKNTLEKFKYNNIGQFQGMFQFSDPVGILEMVGLGSDKSWLDMKRDRFETILAGLNRLNFHRNAKIPGYIVDNERKPLPHRRKERGTRKNEPLLQHKH
ncbi:MAG: hypothetical protein SGARI_008192, partial [Bacillariaceae sp.]